MQADESKLDHYFKITEIAVELNNSNPRNTTLYFSKPRVIEQLTDLSKRGVNFIITGYFAAACYGFVRASTEIELLVSEPRTDMCPISFRPLLPERFKSALDEAITIQVEGRFFPVVSREMLVNEFSSSACTIRQNDVEALRLDIN